MQLTSAILGLLALVSPSLVTAATPGYHSLPWDGRAYNLTVDTLTNKYLTPILVQRNGGNNGNPADYITMKYQARPEGFNDDDGALAIGVDGNAIFSTITDTRRSDLFQAIEGSADGTTFYRASLMKEEAFLNAYDWLLVFMGSGLFEVGVDASANPATLYYRNNGTTDAKWSAEFMPGTWGLLRTFAVFIQWIRQSAGLRSSTVSLHPLDQFAEHHNANPLSARIHCHI